MVIGKVSSVTSHAIGSSDPGVGHADQIASVPTSLPGNNAFSVLGRAPARAAARPRADASAQSKHDNAHGVLQQLGTYGGPLVDGAASALSLASARLSASQQQPAKLTGIVSGALWAGGAAIGQFGNVPADSLVSSANVVGAAAGVLSALATSMGGSDSSRVAYASASAWALNGGANLVRAASDTASVMPSRVLQGVSGAVNIAAAGLAAAATAAAEKNAPVEAANLSTASSVLWGVGAVAALGSAWMAGRREAPAAAIEAPDHIPVLSSHS